MACQVTRSFANRACLDALGRQLQPSRDTGELTAQMQRLWQDLPQGGLGSNPGEDLDIRIVPLWHGGTTLNSRRVASRLVWLVEREERWEASDHPQGYLPLNWGGTKQKRTVTCMVPKANDRRKF
ncbi:uncharacterized protein TNCV_1444481 [Trichonephila clavipes]|nr:uncharacterized protein TNCV_1444481 [Trichonephila clavipes]